MVDNHTLEVTLENPTSYFLELTAFPTLMPVREDIVEANGDGWTLKPETYVSNGPFMLKEYNMKDSYVFVKNPEYYRKDEVKLDTLKFRMIEDEVSAYASVKNGEISMSEILPNSEIQKGQEEGTVQIYPYLGTYFYCINVGNNTENLPEDVQAALSNKKVRQALSLAIDRKTICEQVTKGGQIPAYSYVPEGIPGAEEGKDFTGEVKYWNPEKADLEQALSLAIDRKTICEQVTKGGQIPAYSYVPEGIPGAEEGKDFTGEVKYWNPEKADLEQAKKLLEEAGYPNGEGLPTLELLYNTNEGNKLVAETIQQMWAKINVNVELYNEEWAVFQDSRKNGNYEIARHGWIGDYLDPMTFLDMWMSGLGNNDAKFSNEEYDNLIRSAKEETDIAKKYEYLRKAEDILMDEMPIIPIYYYTQIKAVSPRVKDVVVSPLGQVYFDKAYIE